MDEALVANSWNKVSCKTVKIADLLSRFTACECDDFLPLTKGPLKGFNS